MTRSREIVPLGELPELPATATPQQVRAGSVVEDLRHSLAERAYGRDALPSMLIEIVETEAWKLRRIDPRTRHLVGGFESFEAFVCAAPLAGLGMSIDELRHTLAADRETVEASRRPVYDQALDAIDRVLVRRRGTKPGKSGISQKVDTIHKLRPDGTSRQRALRKLRADAPELHTKVVQGDLSAHEAMKIAGFRHDRRLSLHEDAAKAAQAIVDRFGADYAKALRNALRRVL